MKEPPILHSFNGQTSLRPLANERIRAEAKSINSSVDRGHDERLISLVSFCSTPGKWYEGKYYAAINRSLKLVAKIANG